MADYEIARVGTIAFYGRRFVLCLLVVVLPSGGSYPTLFAQQGVSNPHSFELTPRQREIEKLRVRMQSSDVEERRDAVMKLGWMKHPDSSRVAASALNDPVEIVRATAASAVLTLPGREASALLIPLLKDKKEFVRQQVAYALGETRSSSAIEALVTALVRDKMPSVRGAAAVALGMIADESASGPLAQVVNSGFGISDPKQKREVDQFVQRAAARSLGQLRSRASVSALIAAMSNKRLGTDVRREIVVALGLIGDVAAVPVLREAMTDSDPYLARNAYEALRRVSSSAPTARP